MPRPDSKTHMTRKLAKHPSYPLAAPLQEHGGDFTESYYTAVFSESLHLFPFHFDDDSDFLYLHLRLV